jgi:hypothetical protein
MVSISQLAGGTASRTKTAAHFRGTFSRQSFSLSRGALLAPARCALHVCLGELNKDSEKSMTTTKHVPTLANVNRTSRR